MKYYNDLLKLKSFRLADVVKLTGNVNTAKSVLQRYCQKGYISAIKKGLYTAVNIVDNEPVLNKFEVASILTESSFISYHSAFEYFGYANQVSYEVCVTSKEKFNSFIFNGTEFKRTAPTINAGVITQPDGVRVSCLERTVIDCINNFENHMGLEELLNCISSVPFLEESKLLEYLKEYDKKFLYQKAGFLLKFFQNELLLSDDFFKELKNNAGTSSKYLVKGLSKKNMGYSSKWHLMYPENMQYEMLNGGTENADI
ncbi:MAG: transcriptional regulator [Clostridiales bacterium]|nr:transcriptional regulator [Clostridiales bacterium]